MNRVGSTVLVLLGWHALMAAAFVVWVATLSPTGGGLIPPRAGAVLVGIFVFAPGLLISLGLGSMSLVVLCRKPGRNPVLVGSLATLIGVFVVAAGLGVLILVKQH